MNKHLISIFKNVLIKMYYVVVKKYKFCQLVAYVVCVLQMYNMENLCSAEPISYSCVALLVILIRMSYQALLNIMTRILSYLKLVFYDTLIFKQVILVYKIYLKMLVTRRKIKNQTRKHR